MKTKTYLTQLLDETSEVSDTEIRLVLMNLVEYLKVDVVRYSWPTGSYIAIEKVDVTQVDQTGS
jgi:hypothetical protein